jgi:hypothetical protein
MRNLFSFLVIAILVSGCTAAYVPTPLSANHPASPSAPEAPPPPPSQAFKDASIPPTPIEKAPAQGPHSGYGAMHGGH